MSILPGWHFFPRPGPSRRPGTVSTLDFGALRCDTGAAYIRHASRPSCLRGAGQAAPLARTPEPRFDEQ